SSLLSPPPTPTLFPYTTLFRSYVYFGDSGLNQIGWDPDLMEFFKRLWPSSHKSYMAQFGGMTRPDWTRFIGTHVLVRFGKPVSEDRKSTRLNSSHRTISYAVFC